jgi:hypothetical protein
VSRRTITTNRWSAWSLHYKFLGTFGAAKEFSISSWMELPHGDEIQHQMIMIEVLHVVKMESEDEKKASRYPSCLVTE